MTQDRVSPISAAVRAASRSVSVAELEERGIARIKSIRISRLCEALEQAIQATLMARSVGGRDDESGLASEARRSFVALLAGDGEAGPAAMAGVASQEIDRLNTELDRRRADDARPEPAAAGGDEDGDLERELRRRFRRHAAAECSLAQLEEFVVETSVAAARRERMHARHAEVAARQSDTRFLERRIQKLKTLLHEAERMTPDVDPGLAAGRRNVEGLDPEDRLLRQKADLLAGVFRQNAADRRRNGA